jgi:hypothetical protein
MQAVAGRRAIKGKYVDIPSWYEYWQQAILYCCYILQLPIAQIKKKGKAMEGV